MPAISILLVEDVVQLAQIVQELLEAEDYNVRCVHSYEDATRALHEHHFDLLITDANLGAVSGVDLIRKSKGIAAELKSVLMSGYPIAAGLKNDPAFRCTGFLNKPFSPSDLYQCVRNTLDAECA